MSWKGSRVWPLVKARFIVQCSNEIDSFFRVKETREKTVFVLFLDRSATTSEQASRQGKVAVDAQSSRFRVATATSQSRSKVVSVFLAVLCPAGRAPTSPAPRQFVQVTRSRVAFP